MKIGLIDADAFLEKMKRTSRFFDVKFDIEEMPTIDAVPVVRCKDCKYGEVDDADFPAQYLCKHNGADWNDENHFCSYGEKRRGEDGTT